MKRKVLSILFAFCVFFTLNIPSIKIFYSSEMINILSIIGIIGIGILRTLLEDRFKLKHNRNTIIFIALFITLWVIIFIVTIFGSARGFTFFEFIKYIVLILSVIGISTFSKYEDFKHIINFQVLWAVFLSTMRLLGYIKLSRDLGQHYLTLGMPIGAGVVCMIGVLILIKRKLKRNLSILPLLLLSLSALGSLSGRAPLLLSIIVPITMLLLMIFFERGLVNRIKKILPATISIILIIYFTYHNVSQAWLNRFLGTFNFRNEPRYYIYKSSIDLIFTRPFGIGLDGFKYDGMSYPHNIFLEVAIVGGIFAFLIFLGIFIHFISNVVSHAKNKSYGIIIASLSLFFFLTWNISFNLSSSYVPFTGIALVLKLNTYEDIQL